MSSVLRLTAAALAVGFFALNAQAQCCVKAFDHKAEPAAVSPAAKTTERPVIVKGPDTLVPQTTCPVMGGKINKKLHADHKDKRVYFCCSACKAAFKKDPEKYLKVLEERGEAAETIKKK